jgi:hypothetical protein
VVEQDQQAGCQYFWVCSESVITVKLCLK